MGVDYNVFIGPYVMISNPRKDSFDEFHGCGNAECKKHLVSCSSKFCDTCGTAITLVKKPVQKQIDFNFCDELDENLVPVLHHYRSQPDDFNCLIPNKKFGLTRKTHYDPHCFSGVVDFDSSEIERELVLFQESFGQWLEVLHKAFGKENVDTKWGVIFYAS